MKAATRTARTMTTGAGNAGREDSYLRAQNMGIALHQKWIAALDGRTRHSHRELDGEVQEVGKLFSNGLRFPGDPNGPPAEICNCRCTLIAMLDGFDREKVDRWNKLEGQSYEEWKHGGSGKKLVSILNKTGENDIIELTEEQSRQRFKTTDEIDKHFSWEDEYGDTQHLIDVESFSSLTIEIQNQIANALDHMFQLFDGAPKPKAVKVGGKFGNRVFGEYDVAKKTIRLNPQKIKIKGQGYSTTIHEMAHHYDDTLSGESKDVVYEALRELGMRPGTRPAKNTIMLSIRDYEGQIYEDNHEVIARCMELEETGKGTPFTKAVVEVFLRRNK